MRAAMDLTRKPADRLLAGLLGSTAAGVVLFATGLLSVVAAWVFVALIHVVMVYVARSTARMPGLTRPIRRFWWSVAAAGLISLLGDLAQIGTALRDPLADAAATGGRIQLISLPLGSAGLMVTLLPVPLGFGTR